MAEDEALLERARWAVQRCRAAGAEHAAAWAAHSRQVLYQMRDGTLEQVEDGTSSALSLRLYVAGRYSTHATTDLRPEVVDGFVRDAVTLTRALEPDPHRRLADPELYAGAPGGLALFDPGLESRDRAARIARLEAMAGRLRDQEGVISTTCGVAESLSRVAGVSSNGFADAYRSSSEGLYTEVTLRDGERRPAATMSAWVRGEGALPEATEIADEALRQARARLGMRKGPTRRSAAVVDPRAAVSLLARLLGPASGAAVQQQRSFWRGALGAERRVSDKLSVWDDPCLPRGLGSRPFDSEGIAARARPVLERGVLRSLYLDTYYASKLEMAPTTGSPSNRVVQLGERDLGAIVGGLGEGIYVDSWLGGNMDATTGDFSFGARGHVIEKGAIGAPIGEMNVSGNILELFSNLVEVGSDPWPYSAIAAPTLAFEGVQFSGV